MMAEIQTLELKVNIVDMEPLKATLNQVFNCLEKDREAFAFYEQQHLAKGTPEADQKALVNRNHVARIDACLASIQELWGA
jgi:hypothetical protein